MANKTNKTFSFEPIITALGYLITLSAIMGLGYGAACIVLDNTHKTAILEIKSNHYNEITNLKLEYNDKIMHMQMEIDKLELKLYSYEK